ncbi:hypothetical protein HSZ48_05385 [Staphylococcus saprophyticus]|uniref:hypothetical protein n=1 Tax=Staphylococcus saprophyticus TaxID=29385 RepID=UPI0008533463|nr:hypothetical protein [Staphylococcus saprophyticus]OEK29717.1 hypothetical protein ASS85_11020 [Staphylococcus saprophyticus]QKV11105.1 hypothetical protein HSZ48_05385 [Staphylococcus saprophyticus]
MENFNYDDRKYINLVEVKAEEIEEIYKDYENIDYSIDDDNLLMNGMQVAKITNFNPESTIQNLYGIVDLNSDKILSVSYTE